ncbi:MAG: hypothetical protein ACKO3W_00310 [bacterium]
MNRLTASILALSAAAIANSSASALVFGGNFFVAGMNRIVSTGISQGASSANLPALPINVAMCSGLTEIPVFVVTGPTTAVANGSCYRITATVLAADRFRLQFSHNGAPGSVRSFAFGGGAQKVVFDRRDPTPGTSLSGTGRDVVVTAGGGPWTVDARWTNPIQIGTMPALGDVYNRISFNFSSCFSANHTLQVEFDIDEVM